MDCVRAGTSLTRMTSTGRVIRDPRGPSTQVLPPGMAVMVSLFLYINAICSFNLKGIFWRNIAAIKHRVYGVELTANSHGNL